MIRHLLYVLHSMQSFCCTCSIYVEMLHFREGLFEGRYCRVLLKIPHLEKNGRCQNAEALQILFGVCAPWHCSPDEITKISKRSSFDLQLNHYSVSQTNTLDGCQKIMVRKIARLNYEWQYSLSYLMFNRQRHPETIYVRVATKGSDCAPVVVQRLQDKPNNCKIVW